MQSLKLPASQRQAFADFVSRCRFFDDQGLLDVEKFCLHLYLCLYCDAVPAPEPIALYELLLKTVSEVTDKKLLKKIHKENVADWKENLRSYYPDEQRTCAHFDLLAAVYPDWIRRVGTGLLYYKNPRGEKGRFWIKAEWPLTSEYINRFEAELLRVAGLSRFMVNAPSH